MELKEFLFSENVLGKHNTLILNGIERYIEMKGKVLLVGLGLILNGIESHCITSVYDLQFRALILNGIESGSFWNSV